MKTLEKPTTRPVPLCNAGHYKPGTTGLTPQRSPRPPHHMPVAQHDARRRLDEPDVAGLRLTACRLPRGFAGVGSD